MLPTIPKELQEKWSRMTSENDHQKVREDIATFLTDHVDKRFEMYVILFYKMRRYNHVLHNIPHQFINIECSITDAMLYELEKYYDGKKLSDQIIKCL